MIRIPAIDIVDGSCVRLAKGDFNKSTIYDVDPIELAKRYEDAGASFIHIVDLDAARGIRSNKNIIFNIQKETNLKVQTGGGIKSKEQVSEFLEKGIHSVILGSKAQKNREEVMKWVSIYGSEKIIIGADVRNEKIAIDGWSTTSEEDIFDFILEYKSAGAKTFLCTDIKRDGMLQGTSNSLYLKLRSRFPDERIIASGGVANMNDLKLLEEMNVYACVIGKALFENHISLEHLFPR